MRIRTQLGIFFLFFLSITLTFGQTAQVRGVVRDSLGHPLEGVSIRLNNSQKGTSTDPDGSFRLTGIPANSSQVVYFHSVGYQDQTLTIQLKPGETQTVTIRLLSNTTQLNEIQVKGKTKPNYQNEISVVEIRPREVKVLPSAFGDFNKILATIPGVVSTNELSSTYAVRGGNYDENLVYVNNIEVYRPFLARSGQQEGLSFVNPDLAESVAFSTGGWQAKYGDKLSSVMNVDYKTPSRTEGSLTLGLLGGAAHIEGTGLQDRFTYTIGARRKQSQYILNTLDVKGQYLPSFTDIQGYFNFTPHKKDDPAEERFSVGLLVAYARNRYLTRPESQETTFGTFNQQLRLFVYYAGQELLNYDLAQGGIKLTYRPQPKLTLNFIGSAMHTTEREFYDTENAYRLCEVDLDPGSSSFKECAGIVGVGYEYKYGRNQLLGTILSAENRSVYLLNPQNRVEWGIRYNHEVFSDGINEFSVRDSAGYATVIDTLFTNQSLISNRLNGYLQHTFSPNQTHTLTYGIRFGYWSVNQQVLFSPSMQYAYNPNWVRKVVFRFSAGVYRQPPLYRELRAANGSLNTSLKAQSSLHLIAGAQRTVKLWGRDFILNSEVYYKNLWDAVAYDIDNVRLRYYANNNTRAYAAGADFRLSGEFIKGAESWFSLGILKTQEDLGFDKTGYVRRPTDQRITLGIFFQDHLPQNPSLRGYLNLVFGTGLPFSPPRNLEYRSAFNAPSYRRVDIGFSKIILFNRSSTKISRYGESIWIGLEILNLLGARNVMSYNWIMDVRSRQYAVPNTLSARFLNLRLILRLKDADTR